MFGGHYRHYHHPHHHRHDRDQDNDQCASSEYRGGGEGQSQSPAQDIQRRVKTIQVIFFQLQAIFLGDTGNMFKLTSSLLTTSRSPT